ncbi:SDR family NAD(P)-dependent oxidoreductase [uncultured Abyssibacter sp.]|uniref:SDR family NAD(P)-dependent oxidoreductase n=1 Tax=uncultured Abyssibacter sp. TaxID=2320202 RepID=UPI0032B10067
MASQDKSTPTVTLITGAASGLGWELTRLFFRRGDAVILADLNAALLAEREAELADPDRVAIAAGNLTDAAFQAELVALAEQRFGRLDCLVNNAGITHRSPVRETQLDVFNKVMAVDWQAPVALTSGCLPMLEQSGGLIINVGSMASWMPVPGRAAYCAAKSALAQFFEVLRLEMEPRGVRVLNVYPSFLDTPIETAALGADGKPAAHKRSMVGKMRGADWMAERVLKAIDTGQPWIFGDRISWFGSVLWRVWPEQYLRSVRKRFASEIAR